MGSFFICLIHGVRVENECYSYGVSIRCKQCLKEKNHARYLANKSAILAKVRAYRETHPGMLSKHRETHKEQIQARQRSWYSKNSAAVKTRTNKWTADHLCQIQQSHKKYREEHKTELYVKKKIYRQSKPDFIRHIKRRHALAVRTAAIQHYSNGSMRCTLCGDSVFEHLCLDHVDGRGTQHRSTDPGTRGKSVYAWCKRNGYPPLFRVLCWNCNFLAIPRAESSSTKQIRCMRKLKLQILSHYSGGEPICAKCGLRDIRVLTIDHVGGGGRKHLIGLKIKGGSTFYRWLRLNGFPAGYRVLCFNCNCSPLIDVVTRAGAQVSDHGGAP